MTAPLVELDIVYHIDLDKNDQIADDTARLHAAADWIVNNFSIAHFTASISIVDDETIQQLNREHLDHDWPTDVISFVFERIENAQGPHIDGEVIASSDTARRLSAQANWQANDELLLYCIHGLLHLAGLDDIDDQDRTTMWAAEQECLVALGIRGAENHVTRWDNVSY